MPQSDELFANLCDPEFRRHLEQWAKKVVVTAKAFEAGVEGSEVLIGDWSGSLQEAMSIEGWIEQIFSKVTESLLPPKIVTSEELVDGFDVYFQSDDDRVSTDFEMLYESFLDYVRYRLLVYRSRTFDACRLEGLLTADEAHAAWFARIGHALGKPK